MIVTDQKKLTQVCKSVDPIEFGYILAKMLDEISHQRGAVGLAAPQIGLLKNAFLVRAHPEGDILHFFNPSIVSLSNGPHTSEESCLSIPNKTFIVPRYNTVCVIDDINGQNTFDGLLAIIIQHEYDHLLGKTLQQTGVEFHAFKRYF